METQNRPNEHAAGLDDAALEKILAVLPVTAYSAGETVLIAGSKTGRLLILKRGALVILKDSIEIARVEQAGLVFGELSALLDQPHVADVRAVEDSLFYVADAALPAKDPIALLHVARILARRLIAADGRLVELKRQLQAGQRGHPPGVLKRMIEKVQEALSLW